jgi:tetrahydrodipicolinate N-succinyltransferase
VSIGASGISGTQTAASAILDTGVIVSLGSKVSTPDDQASKINLDLEIPTIGATSTVVFGSINCVAGAVPDVAPAIE